jgi:tetratricopeptide (TPR) repeat protein
MMPVMKRTLANIAAAAIFLALCLVWTALTSAADTPPAPAANDLATTAQPQEIADAVARFKERDFEGALKLLKEAARKNTDLPPAQVIMAQFFSQANIPMGVRNALETAAVDAPTDPEAYLIMGDIALRERRLVEAKMLYEKAGELVKSFNSSSKRKDLLQPRILSGMASVEENQENWAGVQKHLEAWLKLEPKNAMPMQRLARCLFQQKNQEGALMKLKEAAKADAEVLTPEAILGQFYEQAGDRENAKKWMAVALKNAPKDLRTHLVVGQWGLETNQLAEAEKQAAAALQADPKSLDAKILSGVIALFKKDYAASERYFEAAHLQSPRNFAATNNLALVLVEQKDEAKKRRALDYAQSNVQQNQRSGEAASTYGWVLYKLGRLDEAEKAFQAAVSGGSVAPDTAYYIACLSYDRGRESQAKQWLEIALKSSAPFAMRPEAAALMEKLKK